MNINIENLSDAELNLLVNKIAEIKEKRKREKREYFLAKLEELWKDIESAGFGVYIDENGDGDYDFYSRIFFHNLDING